MTISFTVNGALQMLDDADGQERLIDYLHDTLNLTGTKLCCGIGVCRACTVSMTKGANATATPVLSCSTALSSLDGAEITTIEAIAQDGVLDPVQDAFLQNFAFQCGYCTPGFVMAARMFLDELAKHPIPEEQLEAAIHDAIGEHICRCTGYVRYYEALRPLAVAVLAQAEVAQ